SGSTTRLGQAQIDRVIRAYDQSPVTYRGAARPGVRLVVDHGPNSTITPGGATWGGLSRAAAVPHGEGLLTGWREPGYDLAKLYDLVRGRLAPSGRLPLFHYAISADYIVPSRLDGGGARELDRTSGYGVPWGFIVSLGGWSGGAPTADEQAGTFMHELGHTLSLAHGGEDGDNDKPQYASVMNYLFQTQGIPLASGAGAVFDYSRTTTPSLNENLATETAALTALLPPTLGTRHRCPDGSAPAVLAPAPIDWNCNGTTDAPDPANPGFDTNGDTKKTDLPGSSSDWERITFKRGGVGGGTNPEASVPSSGATGPVAELTAEQSATILPVDTTAPSTTLDDRPAPNAAGWHRTSVTLTFTASDAGGSGVVRTEASIDRGAYAAVSGPVVVSAEGEHAIRYRSIDRSQNVEA
ncbi:MAG: OmpL47-type beta-barrel domain-containing protein, partial [Solirubrobacteraceae bacterium]